MFVSPVKEYKRLMGEIKEAESRKNFKDVLYYSLELIPILPSAFDELNLKDIEKGHEALKPINYACNFLTVLEEGGELKGIHTALKRLNLKESVQKEIFGLNIDKFRSIKKYIKNNPGCHKAKLKRDLNIENGYVDKLIDAAVNIGILKEEKGNIYLAKEKKGIRSVLYGKNEDESEKAKKRSFFNKVFSKIF